MSATLWSDASTQAPEIVGKLAVRRAGSGPPLVLVHGGVGSWAHWIANVEPLSRHFALILIDLPGYGDAPAPARDEPEAYIEGVAQDLVWLMQNVAGFGLVGFSFGAAICGAIAGKLGARLHAMSLLGPAGFGVPGARNVCLVPVPPEDTDPLGHRRAVAHNLGSFMLSRVPAPDEAVVTLHSANMARLRFDSRRISHQERLAEDLRTLTCPLQVIWGQEDRLPVPSIQARIDLIKEARPDAECHVVPNAGHWVQYEAPE
jgi:2-hydroxy-6-oxonona-2,4-dienedioate hydrolase